MKKLFFFLLCSLVLLYGCGKKPNIINNTYVQEIKKEQQRSSDEALCEPIYVTSYYDLKLKEHILTSFVSDDALIVDKTNFKKTIQKALKKMIQSRRFFRTFEKVESCIVIENAEPKKIITKDVISKSHEIILKTSAELDKMENNI